MTAPICKCGTSMVEQTTFAPPKVATTTGRDSWDPQEPIIDEPVYLVRLFNCPACKWKKATMKRIH